ncbi:MAG: SDR family NAD(P)-dependent oxidoreductase [Bacteroidales bacterium]|jgi:NAD(P)-dependent dehydrogenase (short-subunit alcohol dehydrogenase family)|nr:SDR family NAD(P)-dependent oxidoreductase [Bacteroidales bacterium]
MYNPFSLQNKTILVTGASSGIGRSTAIECSKMGAILVITARNTERLQETYKSLEGSGHLQIIADLCDSNDMQELIEQLPVLDGCVNNAGIVLTKPFLFTDEAMVKDIFDINFNSQITLIRLLVKQKKINKPASIVIVSSIGGVYSFDIGNSIYSASKAALHSIMKIVALELAAKKIRVNSINPGMINTPLFEDGVISKNELLEDAKTYPLKRYGNPEEVAYGIIYFLSNASAWVTGTSLTIDGGKSI